MRLRLRFGISELLGESPTNDGMVTPLGSRLALDLRHKTWPVLHSHVLHRSLDAQRLLPDIFPSSLRRSSHVSDEQVLGAIRFFYFLTYVAQGASFLDPRAYAILHRMHHAYSDTKKDPHSPLSYTNVGTMMWKTKHRNDDFAYDRKRLAGLRLILLGLPSSCSTWLASYELYRSRRY